ncbi:MAG: MFS transporter [Actinomycetota bacterium]
MRESLGAFRRAFSNPGLRRIQLAWVGSNVAGWAYGVVIAVYAFQQDGAYAVGLVALVRFIAAGIASPLTGVVGDRLPRARVMLAADLIRIVLFLAMAGLVAAGSASLLVYAISVVGTVVGTAFRPAQAALVPSLARTPEELTASNVTSSTTESIGMFVGPALGGVLVAVSGVEIALVVITALLGWSALMVALIDEPARAEREASEPEGLLREAFGGFRVLASDRRLTLLAGLFAAQTFVDGALSVFIVVIAFDLVAVESPESWVGLLNSAAGIGGLAGALAAAGMVTRGRLAANFGAGLLLWGAPLVLIGLVVDPWVAVAAIALTGVANTIVDVMGDTLLQRAVPDDVLARAFGAVEGLMLAAVALGSIAAPFLLDVVGERTALVVIGAILPVAAVVSWPALVAIDARAAAPARELELLRGQPLFAPLDPSTLEYLASRAQRVEVPLGETVFRQGETGDRYYLVEDGRLSVTVDGAAAAELGPGDAFGEIALLRDVPRTATVTALEDTSLLALEREHFLAAVTGHPDSTAAAEEVVGARLAALRPVLGPRA